MGEEKKKQVDEEEKKELAGEEQKGQVEEEKETEKAKHKREGENGGKNKEVILQVDLHCEGCGMKVKKAIRTVQGVQSVSLDYENNKITVPGEADPWKLKEIIESKMKKNVAIISPVNPPKKKDDGEKNPSTVANTGTDQKKKSDSQKLKEVPESTVVLKIRLHCEGCIERIKRTIHRIKGVKHVTVDEKKDLVIVTGTMDVKSLPNMLQEKLKRSVEEVSAKKEDKGDTTNTEKKEKANEKIENGNEKNKKGDESEDKKEKEEKPGKGGGEVPAGGKKGKNKKKQKDANNDEKKDIEEKKEEKKEDEKKADVEKPSTDVVNVFSQTSHEMINRFDFFQPYGYRNSEIMNTPQIFSDENPNACAVM
ncbi:uncharacterized protein LOC144568570 [Carex rostrata]